MQARKDHGRLKDALCFRQDTDQSHAPTPLSETGRLLICDIATLTPGRFDRASLEPTRNSPEITDAIAAAQNDTHPTPLPQAHPPPPKPHFPRA